MPRAYLAYSIKSVLNVKALVGTFKQENAIVGAFSVIVKSSWTFDTSSNRHSYLETTHCTDDDMIDLSWHFHH